jgi:uncharacterized protein DUF3775/ATP synthase gamma subunit
MQAADQNIADKLDKLMLQGRQLRQDAITSELLDIVSGSEAVARLDWHSNPGPRWHLSTKEFDEAVQTARDERVNSTSRYLLGMPLLTDYLKEGLKQLGISSEDAESEVV